MVLHIRYLSQVFYIVPGGLILSKVFISSQVFYFISGGLILSQMFILSNGLYCHRYFVLSQVLIKCNLDFVFENDLPGKIAIS